MKPLGILKVIVFLGACIVGLSALATTPAHAHGWQTRHRVYCPPPLPCPLPCPPVVTYVRVYEPCYRVYRVRVKYPPRRVRVVYPCW
ncbi:MAG: hypothetical protein AB1646_05545 [Thermodesulfobacteriota bacterium]